MLNSSNAAATLRLRSSNCVKTMTLAVLSPRRMSSSFFTTAASFVPYARCRGSSSVAKGAASAGASAAAISSQTGRMSLCPSGPRQTPQDLKFATSSARQLTQKVCAQGVMAMLCSGRSSSKHTEQLRASGEEPCKAASVRSKNSKDREACRNSWRGSGKASTSPSTRLSSCRSGSSFLLFDVAAQAGPPHQRKVERNTQATTPHADKLTAGDGPNRDMQKGRPE